MKWYIFNGICFHYVIVVRFIYSYFMEYVNISVDWLNTNARKRIGDPGNNKELV